MLDRSASEICCSWDIVVVIVIELTGKNDLLLGLVPVVCNVKLPFNLMFSSSSLNAFDNMKTTLEIHLFGLACYTYTKKLQEYRTQEGSSGRYSEVRPNEEKAPEIIISSQGTSFCFKTTNNFLSNRETYISVQQVVPDTHTP